MARGGRGECFNEHTRVVPRGSFSRDPQSRGPQALIVATPCIPIAQAVEVASGDLRSSCLQPRRAFGLNAALSAPDSMPHTYRRHGLSLAYPSNWELREESGPGELTLNHEQPGTGFWTLTLFFDRPDPGAIAEATLAAFRSEYEELDIYETKAKVGRRAARAYDLDFLCYEMTNSACVRVFEGPRFTGLIVYQGTDPEFGPFAVRCEQVVRSIRCYRPGSEESRFEGSPGDDDLEEEEDDDNPEGDTPDEELD